MSVPLPELGPPTPSSASECPPQKQREGGPTLDCREGVGGPNFDDWRKSLALRLLCASAPLLYFLLISTHAFLPNFSQQSLSIPVADLLYIYRYYTLPLPIPAYMVAGNIQTEEPKSFSNLDTLYMHPN